MPTTIRDVASAAGVSVATVSRALNGADNVLPGTKARIVAAAALLRFTPSGAARSLITRRTDTIGALLPDLFGEYFSELIRGIDQAARARGLHLLVSSSHGHADEAAAALRAMSGRVDGLIVMSPHADAEFLTRNLPHGLPAVLLNSAAAPAGGHATFAVDNFGGALAMTQHLHRLGRQRVAFIGGPTANHEARERHRGWLAGLPAGTVAIAYDGDFTEEAGAAAGRLIAAAHADAAAAAAAAAAAMTGAAAGATTAADAGIDGGTRAHRAAVGPPDAVFAANDMMAIGCMAALADAGLRVPADVAVAGFDDIPIARYVSPPLTTVCVGIAELGRRALDGVVDALQRQAQPAVPTLGPAAVRSRGTVRATAAIAARRTRTAGATHAVDHSTDGAVVAAAATATTTAAETSDAACHQTIATDIVVRASCGASAVAGQPAPRQSGPAPPRHPARPS